MSGHSPRTKGKRGELEAAEMLRAASGLPWQRVLEQTRDGDVDLSAGADFEWPVEVKRAETPYWSAWVKTLLEREEAPQKTLLWRRSRESWNALTFCSLPRLGWFMRLANAFENGVALLQKCPHCGEEIHTNV